MSLIFFLQFQPSFGPRHWEALLLSNDGKQEHPYFSSVLRCHLYSHVPRKTGSRCVVLRSDDLHWRAEASSSSRAYSALFSPYCFGNLLMHDRHRGRLHTFQAAVSVKATDAEMEISVMDNRFYSANFVILI